MIARREDVFAHDSQQTSQLSQRSALVIIDVTKTQVNSVALVAELRMPGARLPYEVRDAIHLFLAFGGEAFEALGIVDQTCFRLVRGEIDEFSQHGISRRKQLRVIARASIIPVTERFPLFAILSRTKNVALSSENEIRTNW